VIPIKDTAGGTASAFCNYAEGTPDKHAHKISNVKQNADKKQHTVIKKAEVIKSTDTCK
jgi:hypothetical protein